MKTELVIGIEARNISEVSDAIHKVTGIAYEPHESSYLGEYDLFNIQDGLKVKYNYVESEDEWDEPNFKEFSVLVVAECVEHPATIEATVTSLHFKTIVIRREQH